MVKLIELEVGDPDGLPMIEYLLPSAVYYMCDLVGYHK